MRAALDRAVRTRLAAALFFVFGVSQMAVGWVHLLDPNPPWSTFVRALIGVLLICFGVNATIDVAVRAAREERDRERIQ